MGFFENVINVLFPLFFVRTLSWTPDLEIGSGTLERVSEFWAWADGWASPRTLLMFSFLAFL